MADRPSIPYRFEPDGHRRRAARSSTRSSSRPGTRPATRSTVAGRLMLRRGQGKLAFGTLQDQSGRIQLFAPADVTPGSRSSRSSRSATGSASPAGHEDQQGRAVGEGHRLGRCWPRPGAPFPDKWHGITDPDTRYRQRYVDLWVTEEARRTFLLRSRLVSLTRRWLEDRGFIEVETPLFHPIPGGATGQAVHDAPQRARPGAVPAHRARAVPEAPRGRRLRAGVRDRSGVPQRGHRHPPQPRVHDARAVPGLRRLAPT